MKSELSIRPLYHEREARIKSHMMLAFLGQTLWVTLKHLPDSREIRLRRITEPTTESS